MATVVLSHLLFTIHITDVCLDALEELGGGQCICNAERRQLTQLLPHQTRCKNCSETTIYHDGTFSVIPFIADGAVCSLY